MSDANTNVIACIDERRAITAACACNLCDVQMCKRMSVQFILASTIEEKQKSMQKDLIVESEYRDANKLKNILFLLIQIIPLNGN